MKKTHEYPTIARLIEQRIIELTGSPNQRAFDHAYEVVTETAKAGCDINVQYIKNCVYDAVYPEG